MASNDMNIKVVYETGSFEVISAPDLSINDTYCFQSEYVDLSDPDNGIFWDRSTITLDDAASVMSSDPVEREEAMNPWRMIHQRTCVVPAENLRSAAAVFVCGVRALVRMPDSGNECGLRNVLLESMAGTDETDDGAGDGSEVSAEDYAMD